MPDRREMNEAEDGREQPTMQVRLEAARGCQRPRTEKGAGEANPETGEESKGVSVGTAAGRRSKK